MYNDSLIQITDDFLVVKNYYFPGVSKFIPFEDILCIQVLEPTLMNGSLRIWGTGTGQTWFAMDGKRPWRDAIFVVNLTNSWFRCGFTAESSADVVRGLVEKGIPIEYN